MQENARRRENAANDERSQRHFFPSSSEPDFERVAGEAFERGELEPERFSTWADRNAADTSSKDFVLDEALCSEINQKILRAIINAGDARYNKLHNMAMENRDYNDGLTSIWAKFFLSRDEDLPSDDFDRFASFGELVTSTGMPLSELQPHLDELEDLGLIDVREEVEGHAAGAAGFVYSMQFPVGVFVASPRRRQELRSRLN